MKAFHSNWTAPYLKENDVYEMQDYEVLMTILSALKWREKNGSIKMITDKIGAEYYKKIGIESIWDLGIECLLDEINDSIDPEVFWAAGKLEALSKEEAPVVMIDTDFIVWECIKDRIRNEKLAVIHREDINPSVYPYKNCFRMKENYKFDEQWNWNIKPCNTAFAYFNDTEFKERYTTAAMEFMQALDNDKDRIVNMVFAEQRIISMTAEKMKIKIYEMESLENLLNNKQKIYTHLWGYKSVLKNNEILRNQFCVKIINRIKKDFPEYMKVLKNIDFINEKYDI